MAKQRPFVPSYVLLIGIAASGCTKAASHTPHEPKPLVAQTGAPEIRGRDARSFAGQAGNSASSQGAGEGAALPSTKPAFSPAKAQPVSPQVPPKEPSVGSRPSEPLPPVPAATQVPSSKPPSAKPSFAEAIVVRNISCQRLWPDGKETFVLLDSGEKRLNLDFCRLELLAKNYSIKDVRVASASDSSTGWEAILDDLPAVSTDSRHYYERRVLVLHRQGMKSGPAPERRADWSVAWDNPALSLVFSVQHWRTQESFSIQEDFAPLGADEFLHAEAPQLVTSFSWTDSAGRTLSSIVRKRTDGTPVFRNGEIPGIEVPIEFKKMARYLPPLQLRLETAATDAPSQCLVQRFAATASAEPVLGKLFLSQEGAILPVDAVVPAEKEPCQDKFSEETAFAGRAVFDPLLAPESKTQSEIRFVVTPRTLSEDLTLKLTYDDLQIDNRADWELLPLRLSFELKCKRGAVPGRRLSVRMKLTPSGLVTEDDVAEKNLPPHATWRFSKPELRKILLQHADEETQKSCRGWRIVNISAQEIYSHPLPAVASFVGPQAHLVEE